MRHSNSSLHMAKPCRASRAFSNSARSAVSFARVVAVTLGMVMVARIFGSFDGPAARPNEPASRVWWRLWATTVLAAHGRAKLDTGAKRDVRVALGKSLPDAICWSIAAYVQ